MMSQPSIKKNLLLSTAYQLLTMFTPLITAPYISRVLGADGVGIYSYTYSIETYFSMFAALGTVSYGAREIARSRNDKKAYSKLFWEIELLTVLTSFVCLVAWGCWIAFNTQFRIYYAILTCYLIATMLDISWFYTGLEQFKYTVTQNTVFKLLGIVALFVFVKDKSDVAWYTAIMSLSMLLGNASMWIYLPRFLVKINYGEIRLRHHFKETLAYFIPTIATSIYTVLDKTLIGAITKDANENGYYEQATKIINIAKAITFTSLNSVLGARISYLYSENKFDEIKTRINQSMEYILFIGIGICFGLIGVADNFVPLFFGNGFDKVAILLKLLSPVVVIIGVSNCLGSQYYTPAGLRTKSAKYLIYGSVVNFVLNLILIQSLKSNGAVIATITAELFITILYVINCESIVSVRDILASMTKKMFAGLAMLVVVAWLGHFCMHSIVKLILQVIFGAGVYYIFLWIAKDRFVKEVVPAILEKQQRRSRNE